MDLRSSYPYPREPDEEWGSSLGGRINFTSLLVLDMSQNDFNTSSFPNWLFNLTSLRKLDLQWNSFNSPLPGELANLKFLEYLDLSNSGVQGQIARVSGNLAS
ncbi:receptor-like protein 12 [Prunus yedoensis var. nudiflora]|uniref:Receptor-like protein 12 n=1 Tax=Prunus yedoensis var. nudiflora TaxID=2094558 RepID=A0A314ZAP9_PRUYE|nr:receptor-like protein 12 [Prunus yedoensis var. nudiflora]